MISLFQQDIQYLSGVGPNRRKMLGDELGIHTFGDLLEYFPYKHVDRSRLYSIGELNGDMPFVQVKGHILSFETFKVSARKERVVAHFTDGSGKVMDLTWFNGGKYAKQSYTIGKEYVIFGRPNVYNGRINVTHPDIDAAEKLELSSMGIRVDKESLLRQLKLEHQEQREQLYFHQQLLQDKLPLSIGGGIGQSRLCLALLHKAHVGEIQASIWPDDMRQECRQLGFPLI